MNLSKCKVVFKDSVIMKFQKREKRFFGYMKDQNDKEVRSYCCNSGKMADVLIPGSSCILTPKHTGLSHEWQAININNTWIGVNTFNPNKLAKLLLKELFPNEQFVSEVKFDHYRADFASPNIVVEIKNVHWRVNDKALFPDCVTTRGARQISDLIHLSKRYKCYVIYILQRNDVEIVSIASHIDKTYYDRVVESANNIEYLAFNCNINLQEVSINKQIKYIL